MGGHQAAAAARDVGQVPLQVRPCLWGNQSCCLFSKKGQAHRCCCFSTSTNVLKRPRPLHTQSKSTAALLSSHCRGRPAGRAVLKESGPLTNEFPGWRGAPLPTWPTRPRPRCAASAARCPPARSRRGGRWCVGRGEFGRRAQRVRGIRTNRASCMRRRRAHPASSPEPKPGCATAAHVISSSTQVRRTPTSSTRAAAGAAGPSSRGAQRTSEPSTDPDWGRKPMSCGSTTRKEKMTRPVKGGRGGAGFGLAP